MSYEEEDTCHMRRRMVQRPSRVRSRLNKMVECQ